MTSVLLSSCDGFSWLPVENKAEIKETKGKVTNGIQKNFRNDGSLLSEINRVDGIKHGLAKSYYPSGKLMLEMTYEKGKKTGLATLYYESGKVKRTTNYLEGEKHGVKSSFFTTGVLSSTVTYKENMVSTDLIEYATSGNELSSYPELKYKVIDEIETKGTYTVKFYFTKENKRAAFYEGKLIEGKYFDENHYTPLTEYKDQGMLTFYAQPGRFLMKKIPIIGVVKTKKGNSLVKTLTFNLAIEG